MKKLLLTIVSIMSFSVAFATADEDITLKISPKEGTGLVYNGTTAQPWGKQWINLDKTIVGTVMFSAQTTNTSPLPICSPNQNAESQRVDYIELISQTADIDHVFTLSIEANSNYYISAWSMQPQAIHGTEEADENATMNGEVISDIAVNKTLTGINKDKSVNSFTFIYHPHKRESGNNHRMRLNEFYVTLSPKVGARDRAAALLENKGVGYPVESAYTALEQAVNAEDATVQSIEAAIAAFNAAERVMPETGTAYTIKALYSNGTYRYIGWDAAVSRINVSTTEFADNNGVFVAKKHDDGKYGFYHPATGKFMAMYADGKQAAGNVTDGFAGSYVTETNAEHSWTLESKQLGTVSMMATLYKQDGNSEGNHWLMAGDSNFHNITAGKTLHSETRSSFFVFTPVEEGSFLSQTTLAAHSVTGLEGNLSLHATPYAAVVPADTKAYFIASAADPMSRATEGTAVVKLLAEAGQAIPANTPVLLDGSSAGDVTLLPATKEKVKSVPEGFSNLLAVATEDATTGHVLENGVFTESTSVTPGQVYLAKPEGVNSDTFALDASNTDTTSIVEVNGENRTVLYNLLGRRVNRANGIVITNGRIILAK